MLGLTFSSDVSPDDSDVCHVGYDTTGVECVIIIDLDKKLYGLSYSGKDIAMYDKKSTDPYMMAAIVHLLSYIAVVDHSDDIRSVIDGLDKFNGFTITTISADDDVLRIDVYMKNNRIHMTTQVDDHSYSSIVNNIVITKNCIQTHHMLGTIRDWFAKMYAILWTESSNHDGVRLGKTSFSLFGMPIIAVDDSDWGSKYLTLGRDDNEINRPIDLVAMLNSDDYGGDVTEYTIKNIIRCL